MSSLNESHGAQVTCNNIEEVKDEITKNPILHPGQIDKGSAGRD